VCRKHGPFLLPGVPDAPMSPRLQLRQKQNTVAWHSTVAASSFWPLAVLGDAHDAAHLAGLRSLHHQARQWRPGPRDQQPPGRARPGPGVPARGPTRPGLATQGAARPWVRPFLRSPLKRAPSPPRRAGLVADCTRRASACHNGPARADVLPRAGVTGTAGGQRADPGRRIPPPPPLSGTGTVTV
jgi:hypothetical protein